MQRCYSFNNDLGIIFAKEVVNQFKMIFKNTFFLFLLIFLNTGFSQVYNFGSREMAFKNLINNGVTYVRTGDPYFDSIFIKNMEISWTITDFTVVDQYKRPEKTSTAFFITTKERTKKHMQDRKNQHVLVLQPAKIYVPRKKVKMEQTLGYMYFNGCYDLVDEKDEYRYIYILVKTLNDGLAVIKNKRLTGEPAELNEKVATEIRGTAPPSVGNTLILNREQTRHAVVLEELDKFNIRYRLLGEEEYYETITKKDPTHIILYFAVNRFTEMALVNVANGDILYCKHFRNDYPTIRKKELKAIAPFFR